MSEDTAYILSQIPWEPGEMVPVETDAKGKIILPTLPTDAAERKAVPIVTGLLDYFPNACAAVAELSRIGNEQHNPGQPMHWSRGKSNDHADCIGRHLAERGTVDTDKVRHSTKLAWRSLANLQIELEEALGLPVSRASR